MNKKQKHFPFELEGYRLGDTEGYVLLKTYAIDFELYQIVCRDQETGVEEPVGNRIIGLDNVSNKFDEAIESLSGAYIMPEWSDK